MDDDTDIGGPRARFPTTRLSVIHALRGDEPAGRARAFGTLTLGYWKPVYKYVRLRWRRPNEDAKDCTQAFFAAALEKSFFDGYDPARAHFRTYVRVCLDHFMAKRVRDEAREKRGGGVKALPFDFGGAESELSGLDPPAPDAFEQFFNDEFARHIRKSAEEALRAWCEARGKGTHFAAFRRYVLDAAEGDEPSYVEVAGALGVKVSDVTRYLFAMRREFRRIAVEKLRALTATEDELRAEARTLFGIDLQADEPR